MDVTGSTTFTRYVATVAPTALFTLNVAVPVESIATRLLSVSRFAIKALLGSTSQVSGSLSVTVHESVAKNVGGVEPVPEVKASVGTPERVRPSWGTAPVRLTV